MPSFSPVRKDDRLLYELMPILIGIGPGGELQAYGTCFIAGPNLAITAKHVIDFLMSTDSAAALGRPKFEYWVTQVIWVNDQHRYVVWTIESIGTSAHSDLALIWLRPWDQNAGSYKTWKSMQITLDPPAVGSEVTIFGLHNVRFDGSRVSPETSQLEHLELAMDRSVSKGVVKAHHWEFRDLGLFNFPCYQVDAEVRSGMSGGFVLNGKSEICGVVSGSMPASDSSEEHVSYVTMLWPLMAIPVSKKLFPSGKEGEKYRLRDLCARGDVFTPTGWDRVIIQDDLTNGRALTIQFTKDVGVSGP